MTMTTTLLLTAKTVNDSQFWLWRIAHTTVQDISGLRTCERALLRVLRWHTTYMSVSGVDSPALTKTFAVYGARSGPLTDAGGCTDVLPVHTVDALAVHCT